MKNSFFIHFRSAYVAAGAISHHISWFGSRTEHIATKRFTRATRVHKQKAASGRPPGHGKRKTNHS